MTKNVGQFVREVKQEGLKVTWPTRRETLVTTFVVFVMVFFVAMILLFADWVIAGAIEFILTAGRK